MKSKIMKMAIVAIVSVSFLACGQIDVPQKAKEAFAKSYPQVKNPTWESENGNYESNWKQDGTDHSVLYSPAGRFIGSEMDIDPKNLPEKAKNYISKNLHAKPKEVSLNKDAKNTTTYEADVKGKAYIFDEKGNFLRIGEGD